MPVNSKTYTDAQRGAVIQYGEAHPGCTAPDIVRAAVEGRLTFDGEPVASFSMPASYVRSLRSRSRRARDRAARQGIAALPPRDAVEVLRREILAVADAKVARMKRKVGSRRLDDVTFPEIREAARAVRELAAIPGPEGSPAAAPRPGKGPMRDRVGGETRSGPLASAVHAALGSSGFAVQSDPLPSTGDEYTGTAATASVDRDDDQGTDGGGDPGSFARERIASMRKAAAEPRT